MIRLSIKALALLLSFSPVAALAQDWPAKQPITIVVPFTAGSATDIAGRIVFEQVGKQIGQNFVFENRGGAGTTLGAAMAAKSDPDGYTLLVNSTSQVVVASTYAKLPYSVADDFIPISGLADIPFVVSTATKYKSMSDVMAAGNKACTSSLAVSKSQMGGVPGSSAIRSAFCGTFTGVKLTIFEIARLASLALPTGKRPTAMSAAPSSSKSANQSSDAVSL